MIEVSVRKDGIEVSGHAGYAENGKDIICAGMTALVQTLIKSVGDLTEDKIECEISPGRADTLQESVRSRKASGGFLFHWHLHDC